jgi:DNA polymerase III epsilon subunit-like protein
MTTAVKPDSTSDKPVPQPVAVPPATGNIDPSTLPFFGEDFAYVDTETTGVDPAVDKICEIAIVRYRAGVREIFHTLVDPEMSIPPTASAVHHITDRAIAQAKARGEAPTFAEIAPKVMEMLDGAHVYAHNRSFDEAFVDGELQLPLDPKSWLCTVRLSRHLLPSAPAHGNQVLHYWLQTEPESAGLGPHRAIDDVFTSLENTYHLWKQAEMLGVKTHDGLLELCNRPIIVSTMHFGAHVGKDFKDVPSSYFEWALGRVPGKDGLTDMDEDLRISMEQELARPGRKEDDARIKAEEASKIVPATHMTFGNKHNGKLMGVVPLDYLEWIERENPRCSPEVRAGVKLELTKRRGEAPKPSAAGPAGGGASLDVAASTYVKLAALVRKGSDEERFLTATQAANAAEGALEAYLNDFARAEPAEYLRVTKVIGGREGEWMRNVVDVKLDAVAPAPAAAQTPAPAKTTASKESGRLALFASRSQAEPEAEDTAGPPPELELEGSGAPFASAPAPRRMRPR